ncbi:MAG: molybdopterin-dependent oxidoreductase [Chloroflexi bacterium]|nr:molybdopterin-dependent oxidoreductase [Chloroflexota bacterium]
MKKLDRLPVFSNKSMPEQDPQAWRLVIDGLVRAPINLTIDAVLALPRTALTSDFTCVEGWTVEDITWEGVRVRDLAEMITAMPEARFITFHAGSFVISLPLEEATRDNVILAHHLDGEPIPPEHGGPLRLVTPFAECFQSVKWVQRLEITVTDANDTGRDIALGRIGRGKQ